MSKLKDLLRYERKIYFNSYKGYIKEMLFKSDTYYIWKFMKLLRYEEYFRDKYLKHKAAYLIPLIWYRSKKNKMGLKLGFDIPAGVLGKGARLYHQGQIVINPEAKIGDDVVIIGNVCIGNDGKEDMAATIGNHCTLSWGVIVLGNVSIADNCLIGAGAVVTHDIIEPNSVVVGVPAKVIGRTNQNRIKD
jgi:serine O-acetyltransferase